jgi:hypothetical protein
MDLEYSTQEELFDLIRQIDIKYREKSLWSVVSPPWGLTLAFLSPYGGLPL